MSDLEWLVGGAAIMIWWELWLIKQHVKRAAGHLDKIEDALRDSRVTR